MFLLILTCFIPTILFFLIFLFAIKDFKIRYGLLSIFLGLLCLIPIAILQYFLIKFSIFNANTLFSALITALFFNSLVEETMKMFAIQLFPAKKLNIQVFFAMALLTGLALGCFESIIYLLGGQQQIWQRIITAVLLHASCAGLSSIAVWSSKQGKGKKTPFILAILLHGIYNFFAGFSGGFWWFSIVAILLTVLECRIWYKKITTEITD